MSTERERPPVTTPDLLSLASAIVTAYVGKNALPSSAIPDLIRLVHRALADLQSDRQEAGMAKTPAVAIRRSVTPDYIVCLEDGRKLKMLKRHLRSVYGMTPEDYRRKWDLPSDYPMVAPNYAAQRAAFAKSMGLGHSGRGKKPRR